jgi:hypothetical protein
MLTRRDALTTTVAAGAGLAMASQAEHAKAQAARRIIVDAQVHIWKMHTPERPWPADGIGQAHMTAAGQNQSAVPSVSQPVCRRLKVWRKPSMPG